MQIPKRLVEVVKVLTTEPEVKEKIDGKVLGLLGSQQQIEYLIGKVEEALHEGIGDPFKETLMNGLYKDMQEIAPAYFASNPSQRRRRETKPDCYKACLGF